VCAQGGWLIAGSTYQRELSQKAFFPLISLFLSRSVFCSALLWAAGGNEKRLQPTAAPVAAFLQDK
jgi:hypothetical protein